MTAPATTPPPAEDRNWLNAGNWHWVTKDVLPFARTYLTEQLTSIRVSHSGIDISITSVPSVDGDCSLNVRKGKLITIYDLAVTVAWTATGDVTGTVKIPEVAHDTDDDDYVFDITVNDDKRAKDAVRAAVRAALPPALIKAFKTLLKVLPATPPPTAVKSASPAPAKPVAKPAPAPAKPAASTSGEYRTTVEFMASARDLHACFTDPGRVAHWTQGQGMTGNKPGAPFTLFGGQVTGTWTAVEESKLALKWKLASWTAESTVEMTLTQGASGTKLALVHTGFPADQRGAVQSHWTMVFNRIKMAFGFGAFL
ncbi:hypothetical protein AMAG_19369 [Allomyces macrogynus ATCC 38327]|uniref:Activator of Hsp90 ATPase AHSA1-like N-terminal domain-containing protein n=1 Tax=Allomyces macrogynus (strain ATCC 38327) TaxID=578462 RepID=A0A0L0SUQ9_ALLM3|nr:hypothetical protein AMAG_19369 [Allomyces macrogynus ATCC 38327]|eukprot:KNE66252.1 hypothetical protein AMAG_19369 [Allomyces macrogynus ATCC 38327]